MIRQTLEELVASQKTFKEIEAEFGEKVAINVGIARDPTPLNWMKTGLDAPALRLRLCEVVPHIVERWRRTRGKQKAPTKEPISIRLDADILAYYRASGKGWQG